jgi:electron transport complex protein RnfD
MTPKDPKRPGKLLHPEKVLTVTSSPHAHSGESVEKIMWTVVACLVPAALVGVYFFGPSAIKVLALSIGGCVLVEAGIQRLLKRPITISDGSAVITGLLLAMNLPSGAPWWLVLIGAAVAIGLGKQAYGGLGHNIFNPALVARVFLLISFPLQMTTWPVPKGLFAKAATDAVTGATPLGAVKEQVLAKGTFTDLGASTMDLFMGNVGGCIGEVSAVALLLGGGWLLYKGYITWHIPVSFIGTVLVFALIMNQINPERFADPLFHFLTGGLLLGALFMATDMVTSPLSTKGQIIFGVGCGLITFVIRLFGGYPEGVSFAILLMNATTPLIDRWTVPRKFGQVKAQKKEAA